MKTKPRLYQFVILGFLIVPKNLISFIKLHFYNYYFSIHQSTNLYTVLIFSTKCSKITSIKNLWIKNLNEGTYYEKAWELKVMERKNVSNVDKIGCYICRPKKITFY